MDVEIRGVGQMWTCADKGVGCRNRLIFCGHLLCTTPKLELKTFKLYHTRMPQRHFSNLVIIIFPILYAFLLSPTDEYEWYEWHKYAELDHNPYRPRAIQKLLEIIGRVRLCPSCSFATALDSDINQTTGSGGRLSMWENRCMHAAVCLLRAGQPRSAGDAGKLGQFRCQFSLVAGDPTGLKGLYSE